jgi:hypothetical protein
LISGAGLQTDVAILDFSKAFDTVPHKKITLKNGFVWNTRTNKQLVKYVLAAKEDESCSRGRSLHGTDVSDSGL